MTRVSLRGVAVDHAGRVVVAGVGEGDYVFPHGLLARLLANGALDASFGQGGQIEAVSAAAFEPATLRIAASGDILAAGEHDQYHIDETIPWLFAFGDGGELLGRGSPLGCYPCYRRPSSLNPLPDGSMLIAGIGIASVRPPPSSPGAPALVLAQAREGAFGTPVVVGELPPQGATPAAITATTPDGKVLAAGFRPDGLVVARLLGLASPVAITSYRLQRVRQVHPQLRCLVKDGCRGTLRITVKGSAIVLGRGRFFVHAGQSARATVTLSRSALKRLRRHRTTRATVTATPSTGAASTATVTIAS